MTGGGNRRTPRVTTKSAIFDTIMERRGYENVSMSEQNKLKRKNAKELKAIRDGEYYDDY